MSMAPDAPPTTSGTDQWPALPLAGWADTKDTLHLYLQIVGKVRLALAPRQNHWWHVPLYVNARGLTTGAMPVSNGRLIEVQFDFVDHYVEINCTDGASRSFDLHDGLAVAEFYSRLTDALGILSVDVSVTPEPFDHPHADVAFTEDTAHAAYDAEAVHRFWQILVRLQPVFERFRGRFLGKATPVHLFWHSFDLAYTRFSGREAPPMPDADPVTQDAYSHEVISFGFWAGDDNVPEPAFYAYVWPEPDDLTREPLAPDPARWVDTGNGSQALLAYDTVRTSDAPEATLLAFLESAYHAGARRAGWDPEALATAWAPPSEDAPTT